MLASAQKQDPWRCSGANLFLEVSHLGMLAESDCEGAVHLQGGRNNGFAVADGEAGWLERSESGGAAGGECRIP